jgi:hypothetical protein
LLDLSATAMPGFMRLFIAEIACARPSIHP